MSNPTPEDGERFAVSLKSLRERLGLSQQEVVEEVRAMGFLNFHPTTLSRIESGQRKVSLAEALALARVVDVSVELMSAGDPHRSEHIAWVASACSQTAKAADALKARAKDFRESQLLAARLLPAIEDDAVTTHLPSVRAWVQYVTDLDPFEWVRKGLEVAEQEAAALETGPPEAPAQRHLRLAAQDQRRD